MKLEKDYVNIKLHRDPTSEKSDMYEFIMAFFENGYPEEFIFFQRNYKKSLDISGTLEVTVKIQYLRTFIDGIYPFSITTK